MTRTIEHLKQEAYNLTSPYFIQHTKGLLNLRPILIVTEEEKQLVIDEIVSGLKHNMEISTTEEQKDTYKNYIEYVISRPTSDWAWYDVSLAVI